MHTSNERKRVIEGVAIPERKAQPTSALRRLRASPAPAFAQRAAGSCQHAEDPCARRMHTLPVSRRCAFVLIQYAYKYRRCRDIMS